MTDTAPSHPWRRAHSLVLALVGALALIQTALLIRFTIDDAFITFRYGDTLIQHGVWTWDAWAPRVEGYTNPIYAFLSIVPAALGIGVEGFFKLFSALIAVALTVWFLTRTQLNPWQRIFLVAVTIANPLFHIHLWSGLETPLYVATLVVTFGSLALTGRLGKIGVIAVVLLALTRPEGVAFAGLAVVWNVLVQPRARRAWIAAIAILGGIFAYWTIRALYFGKFFPNTFYVKTAEGSGLTKLATLGLNGFITLAVGGLILVACFALRAPLTKLADGNSPVASVASWLRQTHRRGWAPATVVVFATSAALVAIVLNRSSNLLMNYSNRFEWQLVMPVALVIAVLPLRKPLIRFQTLALAITVASMVSASGRTTEAWLLLAATAGLSVALWVSQRPAAVIACCLALVMACSYASPGSVLSMAVYRPRLANSHQALAEVLRDSPVRNRSLAVGDAGIIPLVSGWHSIDVYGLVNTEVAAGRVTAATLSSAPPSVIIITGGAPASQNMGTSGVPTMRILNRFALDPANGYTYLGGTTFRSNYSMQIYVNGEVDPDTREKLQQVIRQSAGQNNMSDAQFFAQNWRNFPFLHP